MSELTPPTSLVVGSWMDIEGLRMSKRARPLRYGSKAHGYELTGTEHQSHNGEYFAVIGDRMVVSPMFKRSHQAHSWFKEMAKMIIEERGK